MKRECAIMHHWGEWLPSDSIIYKVMQLPKPGQLVRDYRNERQRVCLRCGVVQSQRIMGAHAGIR